MREFLLEIYSEEIPARMQKEAEKSFFNLFSKFFAKHNIKYKNLEVYVGPCRIAVNCFLDQFTPEINLEVKGPRDGANEKALEGFCKKYDISKDELYLKEDSKGNFYYANIKEDSKNLVNILQENFLKDILKNCTWPKSMHWGYSDFAWVRPIRNILCMLGEEVVRINLDILANEKIDDNASFYTNNLTFGHKFMSNKWMEITSTKDYFQKLKDELVIISNQERELIIKNQLKKFETDLQINIPNDQNLLSETANIAEYPVVLAGKIHEKYLSLPKEVLITSMKNHQKFFYSNKTNTNDLAPYFFCVCNLKLDDYSNIIKGYERVLYARLEDALFFFKKDKNELLKNDNYKAKLSQLIFHSKLGDMEQKTDRIVKLSLYISENVVFYKNLKASKEDIKNAAKLAKADLVSEMVGEFPELQGIMGGIYALEEGYSSQVSNAVSDHYKPLGTEDNAPDSIGAIVAMADKLDSLSGLILAGERATSSKDPYALRRLALGIIKIIIENKIDLNINNVIEVACDYQNLSFNSEDIKFIQRFIEERFKFYLKDQIPSKIVSACVCLEYNSNLLEIMQTGIAVDKMLKSQQGEILLALYKRAKNITREHKEELELDYNLLHTDSEEYLFSFVNKLETQIKELSEKKLFENALNKLLDISKPMEEFFEKNMVNIEDQKISNNRKALLTKTCKLFENIANFDLLI